MDVGITTTSYLDDELGGTTHDPLNRSNPVITTEKIDLDNDDVNMPDISPVSYDMENIDPIPLIWKNVSAEENIHIFFLVEVAGFDVFALMDNEVLLDIACSLLPCIAVGRQLSNCERLQQYFTGGNEDLLKASLVKAVFINKTFLIRIPIQAYRKLKKTTPMLTISSSGFENETLTKLVLTGRSSLYGKVNIAIKTALTVITSYIVSRMANKYLKKQKKARDEQNIRFQSLQRP
jgi:hypothetical protein